jgi:hypothetical protein
MQSTGFVTNCLTVSWDVTVLLTITDDFEVSTASIYREVKMAICETAVMIYQTTLCSIPED